MKAEIFHTITIGSIEFIGWISFNGPRIASDVGGSVNIGPCCIRLFKPEPSFTSRSVDWQMGWYVVKYTSEVKIALQGFTETDAIQLSNEFGIPIRYFSPGGDNGSSNFYLSPAFDGLKQWVRDHPRKAKQIVQNHQEYLPDWYEKAIS